jgi:hypothetical protein
MKDMGGRISTPVNEKEMAKVLKVASKIWLITVDDRGKLTTVWDFPDFLALAAA